MYIYVKYYRRKDYIQTIEGGGIDEVMMMMMGMKMMTMVVKNKTFNSNYHNNSKLQDTVIQQKLKIRVMRKNYKQIHSFQNTDQFTIARYVCIHV